MPVGNADASRLGRTVAALLRARRVTDAAPARGTDVPARDVAREGAFARLTRAEAALRRVPCATTRRAADLGAAEAASRLSGHHDVAD